MATDPRVHLAQKYHHDGLNADAWSILAAIVAEPNPPLAALRLAITLQMEAGNFSAALTFCDQSIVAEPLDHEAHFNRGLALEKLGQLSAAKTAYEKSLQLQPKSAVTWNNLGNIFDQLGDPQEAIAAYQRAIALHPGLSLSHNNLGVVLIGQGCFAAACDAFQAALQHDPQSIAALSNLGAAEIERGHVDIGLAQLQRVMGLRPDDQHASDNILFAHHYTTESPEHLFHIHRAWGQLLPRTTFARDRDRSPQCKLRIGYVSPDFRQHSVNYFVEPLLTAHNRDDVEVFCYSNSVMQDAATTRLKSIVSHWREIQGLSTQAAKTLIEQDQIDILVDLAGHTMGNRLDLFAARCAPVQITAIGYPGTTGLPNMDARLCDAISDPVGKAEAWATEKLVRLDGGLHCYQPPHIAPEVRPLPALIAGHITFGSFNKYAKISRATLGMWADVLTQVPTARLIVKAKALAEKRTQQDLYQCFAQRGIAADRVQVQGWHADDRSHLALYHHIDIALDTFPYNGTTTTCEALWMGVPVVTLAGQTHSSRVGASLLTGLGLDDFITSSPKDYVRSAVQWAQNLEPLSELRSALRERMSKARLCDPKTYARSVEKAYRTLWQDYCQNARG